MAQVYIFNGFLKIGVEYNTCIQLLKNNISNIWGYLKYRNAF